MKHRYRAVLLAEALRLEPLKKSMLQNKGLADHYSHYMTEVTVISTGMPPPGLTGPCRLACVRQVQTGHRM